MPVLDLDEFRKERERQATAAKKRAEESRPRWSLVLNRQGVVEFRVPQGAKGSVFRFTEPLLKSWSEWFRSYERILMRRRLSEARVTSGLCRSRFCKRKSWRGTGGCRTCNERTIERARLEMRAAGR